MGLRINSGGRLEFEVRREGKAVRSDERVDCTVRVVRMCSLRQRMHAGPLSGQAFGFTEPQILKVAEVIKFKLRNVFRGPTAATVFELQL